MLPKEADKVPFECPNCGHKFSKTLASLKDNPKFPCPAECGATFAATPDSEHARMANVLDSFKKKVIKLP